MKVSQKLPLKKSFLLTRDISLNDIVNPNERTTLENSAIFMRKHAVSAEDEDSNR